MAFDLEYWDAEKNCSICGDICHYSRDCSHLNDPQNEYEAFIGSRVIGMVVGRTSYQARQNAQSKFEDEIWDKIEVRLK